MSGILVNAVRSGIQYVWGSIAGVLAALGIALDAEQSKAVEIAVGAIVMSLVVAGLRWLETRQGDGWERWARKAAALLMLGMSGSQPTYQSASSDAQTGSKTAKPAARPRPVTLSVDAQRITPEMAEAMKRGART